MPSEHVRRGRPKGSGLDDRAQLNAIAQLLATDRSLKPTTAIKRMGVTDPSTIRRLRDKLRAFLGEPPATHEANGEPDSEDERGVVRKTPIEIAKGSASVTAAAAPRVAADQAKVEPREPAAPERIATKEQVSESPPPSSEETAQEWFAQWCALGLHILTATAEAQRVMAQEMLRSPPVASVLRNQVRLNEVAKAFCAKSSDVRRRKI